MLCALREGYRRIDTAACYRNEADVARGIDAAAKELGITRKDVFITSKLSNWDMKKGEEHAYRAALDSLKKLDTDYFDLYLIHW